MEKLSDAVASKPDFVELEWGHKAGVWKAWRLRRGGFGEQGIISRNINDLTLRASAD